jgi:hypothetical protein
MFLVYLKILEEKTGGAVSSAKMSYIWITPYIIACGIPTGLNLWWFSSW